MKKKKRTPFATNPDGKLFVKLVAVTSHLVALIDGLTFHYFPGRKTAYLDIDTAIEWTRKELPHDPEKYQPNLTVLERAKAQADAERQAVPV